MTKFFITFQVYFLKKEKELIGIVPTYNLFIYFFLKK